MATSGQQMFAQMKQKESLVRNAALNAEVNCVVSNLLSVLPADWQSGWEVRVFENKDPNAFALPGRKIGVNSGMMKLIENDAQLAAVIGHEIGHVLSRHAAERASMGVVAQLGQEVAGQVMDPVAATAVGLGAQVGVLLPYSRTHEGEADTIGQNLMAQAGFDPRESIRLWQLMARQGGAKPPELLSTHPASQSRIDALSQQLRTTMPIFERARAAGRRPYCGR